MGMSVAMIVASGVFQVIALNSAALRPGCGLSGLSPINRMRCARPCAISVPGFGSGSGSTGPSEETLEKYRLLGLAEDATYDEINAAYDELAEKYEGNTKMTI